MLMDPSTYNHDFHDQIIRKSSPKRIKNDCYNNNLLDQNVKFQPQNHLQRITGGSHRYYTLNDFEIGRKLGKGRFGKVYCVRDRETGYICALKVMSKKDLTNYKVENQFSSEIEIQSNLR